MLRSMLILCLLASLALLGWNYRALYAVDPLSVPAKNDGWALTATGRITAKTETATFAAGCFWGTEAIFRKVPGVIRTRVGYTGGSAVDPSYPIVASQRSGHAEAVDVEFDPAKVSYSELLTVFFNSHDPTELGRSEYRSAVFYHSAKQRQLAEERKRQLDASGEYGNGIATAVVAAGAFYPAEEYHQRYYESRGVEHYCTVSNGKKPVHAADGSAVK